MSDLGLDPERTAVLITDPEVDFLTPESVVWEQVGETVEENTVVEKLRRLRDAASEGDVPVFYSPHYYEDAEYEEWEHLDTFDEIMFDTHMFDGDGDGSDFVPALAPDENTFVLSPQEQLSGFWSNDAAIQLRHAASRRSSSPG